MQDRGHPTQVARHQRGILQGEDAGVAPQVCAELAELRTIATGQDGREPPPLYFPGDQSAGIPVGTIDIQASGIAVSSCDSGGICGVRVRPVVPTA